MRFLYTLARDLGIHSVKELGNRLSGQELAGWIAFYDIDGNLQRQMSKGKSPKAAIEYVKVLESLRGD